MPRFVINLLILLAALAAGPPLAAKDAAAGLFVAQGQAFVFKVVDGQPVEPRAVGKDAKPGEGEVMVSLDGGMMTVLNRTAASLNYHAYLARSATDKGKRTSVCTLMPGISAFENWLGGVPGVRLADFTPAGDGMICA